MATAQVIVTYEFEVEGDTFQDLWDAATSTPWTIDKAIDSDIHIYDNEWNELSYE